MRWLFYFCVIVYLTQSYLNRRDWPHLIVVVGLILRHPLLMPHVLLEIRYPTESKDILSHLRNILLFWNMLSCLVISYFLSICLVSSPNIWSCLNRIDAICSISFFKISNFNLRYLILYHLKILPSCENTGEITDNIPQC